MIVDNLALMHTIKSKGESANYQNKEIVRTHK